MRTPWLLSARRTNFPRTSGNTKLSSAVAKSRRSKLSPPRPALHVRSGNAIAGPPRQRPPGSVVKEGLAVQSSSHGKLIQVATLGRPDGTACQGYRFSTTYWLRQHHAIW